MYTLLVVCQPDIVIYECAERVDRSNLICKLAEDIKSID